MSLHLHSLYLTRNQHVLFHDFSLSLHAGECVLLKGTNGSGKSSLLEVLSGVLQADKGTVSWFGLPLSEANRTQWHYLAHADALKDELSIAENIYFQAALCAYRISSNAFQEALTALNLYDKRHIPVGYLSQGQKRRSALLHLLLLPFRPVWLLDEPFNALDLHARHTLSEWINQHIGQGGSVLFTHHFDLPENLLVNRAIQIESDT